MCLTYNYATAISDIQWTWKQRNYLPSISNSVDIWQWMGCHHVISHQSKNRHQPTKVLCHLCLCNVVAVIWFCAVWHYPYFHIHHFILIPLIKYTFSTEILSSLYERPWSYWEQSWTSATSMQANSSSHRKSDTFDTFDEIWDEAEDITDSCLHLDDTNSNYFLTFNLDHVRTEDNSSNIR